MDVTQWQIGKLAVIAQRLWVVQREVFMFFSHLCATKVNSLVFGNGFKFCALPPVFQKLSRDKAN